MTQQKFLAGEAVLRDCLQAAEHREMTLTDLSDELLTALRQHLRLSLPDDPITAPTEPHNLGLPVARASMDDHD